MFEQPGEAAAAGMAFSVLPAVTAEWPARKAPFATAILGFFMEMAVMVVRWSHVCHSPFLFDTL
jgi:uncharacterized integral membrane protein